MWVVHAVIDGDAKESSAIESLVDKYHDRVSMSVLTVASSLREKPPTIWKCCPDRKSLHKTFLADLEASIKLQRHSDAAPDLYVVVSTEDPILLTSAKSLAQIRGLHKGAWIKIIDDIKDLDNLLAESQNVLEPTITCCKCKKEVRRPNPPIMVWTMGYYRNKSYHHDVCSDQCKSQFNAQDKCCLCSFPGHLEEVDGKMVCTSSEHWPLTCKDKLLGFLTVCPKCDWKRKKEDLKGIAAEPVEEEMCPLCLAKCVVCESGPDQVCDACLGECVQALASVVGSDPATLKRVAQRILADDGLIK